MVRRLVLSFFLASAFHSFDVLAGPCRPRGTTANAVTSIAATSDASTDISWVSTSKAADVSTSSLTVSSDSSKDTATTHLTESLSLSVPTSLVTAVTSGVSESYLSLPTSLATTLTVGLPTSLATTLTDEGETIASTGDLVATSRATTDAATDATTDAAVGATTRITTGSVTTDEEASGSSTEPTASNSDVTSGTVVQPATGTATGSITADDKSSGSTTAKSTTELTLNSATTNEATPYASAEPTTEVTNDTVAQSSTEATADPETTGEETSGTTIALTTDATSGVGSESATGSATSKEDTSDTTAGLATDATSDITAQATTEVTSGSATQDAASDLTTGDTTTEKTTDISTETTNSVSIETSTGAAAETTIGSSTETALGTTPGTTTGAITTDTTDLTLAPTTTSLAYCSNSEWLNDALIASFTADKNYAEEVCTAAIQPVTTIPATTGTADQPVTTVKEIIPVTEHHDGETKIVIDAPSTDYIAGADKTVTAVRRDNIIDILEPKTIYNTVGRTTIELPTAYETVFTTDVDYIGTTSVETILDVETQTTLVITDTVEIATSTGTDVVTETITSIETIPTTSTEYVVTGTDIRYAPRMRVYVTKSRTFVIYTVPSTRLHAVYTTTDYLTSTWTTVTVQSTETDYTTVPTTTFDVTTTATTVKETIFTSTEIDHVTSTVTTNEWTTETSVSTSIHTKISIWNEHYFPWLQNRKRAAATAGLDSRAADPVSPEQGWLKEYGEDHVLSACSCIVTFPLPTLTVYAAGTDTASADYMTITERSTTFDKIYGDTVTLTLTTPATVTTHKTVTETVVLDGTTTVETRTVHEDVTETVFSTPTAQELVTKVVYNDDVKEVTKEIAVTDKVTLYGVATGYTWVEVKRTQDLWDIRSKLVTVGKTIDIADTSTATLPPTTVETTVEVTSTALSTADDTIYDAFTKVVPVAVTDVKKFTYTATIFTDATSTYSIDATHTVGTIATTTLTTFTTIKNGVTSTVTTVLTTDVTVTAQAIATETCNMPIADGDFEFVPGTSPWWKSKYSAYDWDKVDLGAPHKKVMQTNKLYDNKEFLAYQDVKSCKGVTFRCGYEYYFDKYYRISLLEKSTNTYKWWVPYLRMSWNDDWEYMAERWPESTGDAKKWMSANIEFTTTGKWDTLWIYAGSPQSKSTGDNFVRLDNFVCRPIKYRGHYGPVGGFQA
ncbi:hypothetical protein ACHAPA_005222 [Fusarium lateritium]